MVIVSRHCGEKTSGRTGQSVALLQSFNLPTFPAGTLPRTLLLRSPYLLVLYLEVEMATEPVIEGRLVDITRCTELGEEGGGECGSGYQMERPTQPSPGKAG